jgi:hypothetical protein
MVATNRVPAPAPIQCPSCGGNVELRGFGYARSAVCLQCLSIIDPTSPDLQILQKFDERNRVRPLIPLGSRGKLHGTVWEAIGFQVRTVTVDGLDYSWHEYLLFNPYKGFRYLTQYDGHWNDVVGVRGLPAFVSSSGRKAAAWGGRVYSHFQHGVAETTFVMGEFPWAVRVGERVEFDDFVAPPGLLSLEKNDQEITWSLGSYIDGRQIWQAFQLAGAPPTVRGVFANQPSPYAGKPSSAWRTFLLLMIAWAALLMYFSVTARNKEAFRQSFHYAQTDPGEHSFVTPVFEIDGNRGNVEVEIRSDLDNNWAYFNLALLREDGEKGFDFGREVSYYHGSDSDGSWSEGKARDSVVLPSVAGGRYYLRIEPEMDPQASAQAASGMSMNYDVVVRRDVPHTFLFWLFLPLFLIPPIVVTVRAAGFETARWAESDYSGGSLSSGGDDD